MENLPYYLARDYGHRFDRDSRYERLYPGIYRLRSDSRTQIPSAQENSRATAETPIPTPETLRPHRETSMTFHEEKIRAISEKFSHRITFSHTSAARIYGFILPDGHEDVHIYQLYKGNSNGSPELIRHTTTISAGKAQVHRGVKVTDPFRTVIDCVRILPVVDGFILADSAMRFLTNATRWNQAEAMQSSEKVLQTFSTYLDSMAGAAHIRKTRAVISYASPLSDSPYESRLRLLMLRANLPVPQVQPQLYLEGKSIFPDLLISARQLKELQLAHEVGPTAIEFDGAIKYASGSGSGSDAQSHPSRRSHPGASGTYDNTLLKEKRREDSLRRAGYHVVRFTASDLTMESAPMRQLLQLVPRIQTPEPLRKYLKDPQ